MLKELSMAIVLTLIFSIGVGVLFVRTIVEMVEDTIANVVVVDRMVLRIHANGITEGSSVCFIAVSNHGRKIQPW